MVLGGSSLRVHRAIRRSGTSLAFSFKRPWSGCGESPVQPVPTSETEARQLNCDCFLCRKAFLTLQRTLSLSSPKEHRSYRSYCLQAFCRGLRPLTTVANGCSWVRSWMAYVPCWDERLIPRRE